MAIAMMGMGGKKLLDDFGYGNAVEGLSGLISLGNAWESIDIFNALAVTLNVQGRSTVAYLAQLRMDEIIDHGGHSFLPEAPTGDQLKSKLMVTRDRIDDNRKGALLSLYKSLRHSAEDWQANRTAYMEVRLKTGSHPDTDPDFWADYKETPRPPLSTWRDLFVGNGLVVMNPIFPVSVLVLAPVLKIWQRHRKAAARPSP